MQIRTRLDLQQISPNSNVVINSFRREVLIDVRTPVEFAEVHAEGARLVPLDVLDPGAAMKEHAGSGEPIYVICKSGNRASKAVERFHAAGFHNVLNVEGGTDGWVKAGLPVVRSATKVISLERQVRIGAGLLVLIGVVLGFLVHPAFFGLSAFVGAGLTFAGITDWCGMGLLLAKLPWNNRAPSCGPNGGPACSR
jgi:rhodanese-related sulfurtransferase